MCCAAHLLRQLLRVLADVLAARLGMRERVLDRGADRRSIRGLRSDVVARIDSGQRDRQPGLALPPVAEVGDLDEAVLGVGEAALVDDQARRLPPRARPRRGSGRSAARRRRRARARPGAEAGTRWCRGRGSAIRPAAASASAAARGRRRAARRRCRARRRCAAGDNGRRPPPRPRTLSLVRSSSPARARWFSSSMSSSTGSTREGRVDEPVDERVEREGVVRARSEAEPQRDARTQLLDKRRDDLGEPRRAPPRSARACGRRPRAGWRSTVPRRPAPQRARRRGARRTPPSPRRRTRHPRRPGRTS